MKHIYFLFLWLSYIKDFHVTFGSHVVPWLKLMDFCMLVFGCFCLRLHFYVYFVFSAKCLLYCFLKYICSLSVSLNKPQKMSKTCCLFLAYSSLYVWGGCQICNWLSLCLHVFIFRSPTCQSLSGASACSGGQPYKIPLLCKGQPSRHTLQVRS